MTPFQRTLILTTLLASGVVAQIQIGTIRGVVKDPAGALLTNAAIQLIDPVSGLESSRAVTDGTGTFVINNVRFGRYALQVLHPGFSPSRTTVSVNSNLPVDVEIATRLSTQLEQVLVEGTRELLDPSSTSSSTTVTRDRISDAARANRGRQLQELIANSPGMATENNGLLHVRGVEDGILYIVDGIPIADRIDSLSATSFDTDTINSLQVLSGSYPAEFGGRNGAIVVVQPSSGIDQRTNATLRAGASDYGSRDIAGSFGAKVDRKLGFFVNAAAFRSRRYLDPVDPNNYNNTGAILSLGTRVDWHPSDRDTVLVNGSANGSDFDVTNDAEQQVHGQRQRQELRDEMLALSWQRLLSDRTVSNLAFYYRRHRSMLFGSEYDLPIFAEQDRTHTRMGVIASLTHQLRGHTIKGGIEASRVAPHEYFRFHITDEEEAEEREVSDQALEFDADNPFVFNDRRVATLTSIYLQDQFSPLKNLTLQVGLRYDHSTLLVRDQQFSPRIGASYFVPQWGALFRASFNRLYQPPQVDNILLSSSSQARALSPFSDEGHGGAEILPEKVSAWEVGFSKDIKGWARFDAVYWHRNFRNAGDPNVFFNTTVIFPNSVASGYSRGTDFRLDVPERHGWSAWMSYTNMRILQTGPLNGGLFLTDEFIAIGPGVQFIPDQDQRNTGAMGVSYHHRWNDVRVALTGRHESGVPLEVDEGRLEELMKMPGSELVNFERGRVKPRTLFNISVGLDFCRSETVKCRAQLDVLNIADKMFAYNFGNPFEGTHFGYGRRWSGGLRFEFR